MRRSRHAERRWARARFHVERRRNQGGQVDRASSPAQRSPHLPARNLARRTPPKEGRKPMPYALVLIGLVWVLVHARRSRRSPAMPVLWTDSTPRPSSARRTSSRSGSRCPPPADSSPATPYSCAVKRSSATSLRVNRSGTWTLRRTDHYRRTLKLSGDGPPPNVEDFTSPCRRGRPLRRHRRGTASPCARRPPAGRCG